MFAKLRTSRFMKAKGSDSAAVVEFTGKVQRMARVHQYGLKTGQTATAGMCSTRRDRCSDTLHQTYKKLRV